MRIKRASWKAEPTRNVSEASDNPAFTNDWCSGCGSETASVRIERTNASG